MAEAEDTTSFDVNPDESPFPVPAIEGLPFSRDSAEARAIRRILGEADGDSGSDG